MHGLVTVFGGSGFIGRQAVRALAKRGFRVRVACRRTNLAYRSRLLGEVGQIEVMQANIRVPSSVHRALEGAEACVNLVGVLYEHGAQCFSNLHVEGAHEVAKAAKAQGVSTLVQMSALGADAKSKAQYARTKAQGEWAARAEIPSAVVVRPSVVFGPEDDFFNRFAKLATISPVLPLPGGGHTRFQPVFVGDVAAAIAACVADPAAKGRTYELGGPAIYSFRELMQIVLKETQRRRALLSLPRAVAEVIGALGDLQAAVLPIAPPLTTDQVEMLGVDNVVDPQFLGLKALGITPTAVEAIVPTYLYRYRRGGQFAGDIPLVASSGA